MRPAKLELIGTELAVQWEDGQESYIPLEVLRRNCPCATCKGEVDVMGQLHKGPESRLLPSSFEVLRLAHVGGYAIQPTWGDGHASGIYPYDYLRRLSDSLGVA